MTIDIEHLSIEELETLNERIVRRLQFLDGVRAQQTMMALNIGNRVHFDSPRHGRVFATVIKFNQKTVSVVSDDKRRWNVPPHLLTPVKDANAKPSHQGIKTIKPE